MPPVGLLTFCRQSPVQIASGATLDLNGRFQTIASLANSGGGGGSVINSASATPLTLTINPTSGSTTFSGTISDSGSANAISLVKSGAGTQVLSGNNTYSGGTTTSGGTLQFAKLISMPNSGAVAVSGATLAVNVGGSGEWTTGTSGNGTIGGLLAGLGGQSGGTVSWTGNVGLGLDTTDASSTQTYSGNIANVGTTLAITKLGTGTLTLSGANSYSGGTTVNGGVLTIGVNGGNQGSTVLPSGTVTVNSGGAINFYMSSENNRNLSGAHFFLAGSGPAGQGALFVNVGNHQPRHCRYSSRQRHADGGRHDWRLRPGRITGVVSIWVRRVGIWT